MPADLFINIKVAVCDRLKNLNPHLTYHNLFHTLDVLDQAERIAIKEGITSPEELFLLKVAALYHDTGFLETYKDHEKMSCTIFLQDASQFSLTKEQKDTVVALIMSTCIPQTPANLLESIICDADLDYLGRDDFFEIGDTLRREFLYYNVVGNNAEWEKIQLNFFQKHQYHTTSSRAEREPVKKLHYSKLLNNNMAG